MNGPGRTPCLTFVLLTALPLLAEEQARPPSLPDHTKRRILEGYGRLPLRFERNEGQTARPARYLSRGPGYTVFVMPTEVALSLFKGKERQAERGEHGREEKRRSPGAAALRVKLLKARSGAQVEGLEELPGTTNYFIGGDPKRWRTHVPGYEKVRCRGVYPGIDVVYYGRQRELEYDFVVAPGADPRRIRLGFDGARSLKLDGEGNLVVALGGGEVVQRAPRIYQKAGSKEEKVLGRWVLGGEHEARFEVGAYDAERALVIDPVLVYSTYLGGSLEDGAGVGIGNALAVDGSGNAYVTGSTESTDFPTQTPYQTDQAGYDVFVTKLSPSGDSLIYSTYLGGSSHEDGGTIAVDESGSAYVSGRTDSVDFPTLGPYQTDQADYDIFVTKLSPSGDSLAYSTYLGGGSADIGQAIAVDVSGSAYVTGVTLSRDFPTQNAYQTDQGVLDAFVTKLSSNGSSLVYSTYLGGSSYEYGLAIAVDGSGSAYVAGRTVSPDFPTRNPHQTYQGLEDVFVTKLAPSGNSLVYSTYLGGSSDDYGHAIAVDESGNAYVTGVTHSMDFPTKNPYQTDQGLEDAFVTKLSSSGGRLVYSTYLGGSDIDRGRAIAVDESGRAFVTGESLSTDFPMQGPYQTDQPGYDAFVTTLSPAGDSLAYSTYLGGDGVDWGVGIALEGSDSVYVMGVTDSTDYPTQNPYQTHQGGYDAFVTKLGPPPPTGFFIVPPCRLIDTRNAAGAHGGPPLAAGADRTFTLAGQCGIPPTARSVAVNITVSQATAVGNLQLYPAGAAVPQATSINYAAGQTRANNAIVLLTSGGITVRCNQAAGTVHLIVDTSGYFQ